MELEHEVKTVTVDFQCPKCLKGRLRPTGQRYLTHPAQYPHKCNNQECDYVETFRKTYPYIDYRKI